MCLSLWKLLKSSERLMISFQSYPNLKLAAKHVTFAAFWSISMLVSITFLKKTDQKGAYLTFTSFTTLQVKILSFVYLVELLNFRIAKLLELVKVDANRQVLKLHSKVFELANLILKTTWMLVTLITLNNCSATMYHSLSIFNYIMNVNVVRLFRELHS